MSDSVKYLLNETHLPKDWYNIAADLPEDRTDDMLIWQKVTNIDFVDFEGDADRFGHSYFLTNPNASSDLVLLLRYGFAPGEENGRPLEYLGAGFWRIPDDFPSPSG